MHVKPPEHHTRHGASRSSAREKDSQRCLHHLLGKWEA